MMNGTSTRIQTLDAFRGIAILAVIGFHYTFSFGPRLPAFEFGSLGVEFFFIISGFVIFMTLERCRSIAEFAFRRFSRLYPCFLVCLTLTFLIAPRGATILDYVANLTLAAPHFGHRWVDIVYWSLLVELKFYFWVALAYFSPGRNFIAKWIVFCLASTQIYRVSDTLAWLVPTLEMPFFLSGMGFYLWFREGRLSAKTMALLGAAAILYALTWRASPLAVHVIVALMIVAFVAFVNGWMSHWKLTWLSTIGTVSYPLYLIHRGIGVSVIERLGPWWAVVPGVTLMAIGAASLLHYGVEEPSQKRLRRMFSPTPSSSPKES